MSKKKVKLTVTNMVVMLAFLTVFVGMSWQQVGAQQATASEECSAQVDKRAAKEDVHSDCVRDEKSRDDDDGMERVAALIGIDVRTLWAELEAGNSIASVAQANGVEPQTMIDALVAEKQAEINELLAAGEISEEKAAAWQAKLVKSITFRVYHVEVEPFVVAAQTIGIHQRALWEELKAGKTVAELAQANGVEPQMVVDAVSAAEDAQIEQMLAAGFITEAEAQESRNKVHESASAVVNMRLDELKAERGDGEKGQKR